MSVTPLVYQTSLGKAYQGDSRALMESKQIPERSVDLIFTSPPFALTRQKDYGNKSHGEYIEWFSTFLDGFDRILSDRGSIVVDIGGAYVPGRPQRSTYHFELALLLARRFQLCQEFYWYNPSKLPGPAEWTNVRRLRVKDSVNLLLWVARDASDTHAKNSRVLKEYSLSMQALLKNGYQVRKRPSNHDISDNFLRDNQGAIPPNLLGFADPTLSGLDGEPFEELFDNLLAIANTSSSDLYLRKCAEYGIKPHGARFPIGLPAFFIKFLTEDDRPSVVFDPFAGSNTTGAAAEALGRKWASCDLDDEGSPPGTYVRASAFRFPNAKLVDEFGDVPASNWQREVHIAKPELETPAR